MVHFLDHGLNHIIGVELEIYLYLVFKKNIENYIEKYFVGHATDIYIRTR